MEPIDRFAPICHTRPISSVRSIQTVRPICPAVSLSCKTGWSHWTDLLHWTDLPHRTDPAISPLKYGIDPCSSDRSTVARPIPQEEIKTGRSRPAQDRSKTGDRTGPDRTGFDPRSDGPDEHRIFHEFCRYALGPRTRNMSSSSSSSSRRRRR